MSRPVTLTADLPWGDASPGLDEIDIARSDIEANVVEIRGLEIMVPFVVEQLTRTELHQIIRDEWLAEYSAEEARNDAITLSAFDFLAKENVALQKLTHISTERAAHSAAPAVWADLPQLQTPIKRMESVLLT